MAGTKSMDKDHWDFLELIEAPMWADLTIEAELMEKDSDDAWFRTSHPIHQMSSRQLRSSSSHDKDKCLSPKVPDSVSRSRGKHYKSRRWEENVQNPHLVNKGNVRKLDGKSLGTALEKAASCSSSTSTVTISTSCRKPSTNLVKKSVGKTGSIVGRGLSNSVATNCKSFRSKSNIGGPGSICNAKKQTSMMVCNSTDGDSKKTGKFTGKVLKSKENLQNRNSSSGKSSVGSSSTLEPILEAVNSGGPGSICNAKKQSSRMVCSSTKGNSRKSINSTGKLKKDKEVLQSRNSFAGKSSVGSSSSLGPLLEVVNSDEMKRVKGKSDKDESDSSVQASTKYVKGRISVLGCQNRGQKSASQESNSKDLRSVAPRNPLLLLNGSRTTKELVLDPRKINCVMKKLDPASNKEKATERRKLQSSKTVERPGQSSGGVKKNSGLVNKENTKLGKLSNSETMRRKTLFSSTKGKPISNMQARNSVAEVPVTYFR